MPISSNLNQVPGNFTPGITTWDWQGGEPAPLSIRTPWLASMWHYDEYGRIVPNDPSNPRAPWNMAGSTMNMEEWYNYMGSQYPGSEWAKEDKARTERPLAGAISNALPSSALNTSQTLGRGRPLVLGGIEQSGGMYSNRNQLAEFIKKAMQMRGGY